MAQKNGHLMETPGSRFAETLQFLVNHRGLGAEQEIVEVIGLARLMQIYNGDEPKLGEFLEIARILRVPLSAFQISGPGEFPELEIAFAAILYRARVLDKDERHELADRLTELAKSNGPPIDGPDSLGEINQAIHNIARQASPRNADREEGGKS